MQRGEESSTGTGGGGRAGCAREGAACLRYNLAHRLLLLLHLEVERGLVLNPLERAVNVLEQPQQDCGRIGSLGERAARVLGELEPGLECRLAVDGAALDLQLEQRAQHLHEAGVRAVGLVGLELVNDVADLGLVDPLRGSGAATPAPLLLHIRLRRASAIIAIAEGAIIIVSQVVRRLGVRFLQSYVLEATTQCFQAVTLRIQPCKTMQLKPTCSRSQWRPRRGPAQVAARVPPGQGGAGSQRGHLTTELCIQ